MDRLPLNPVGSYAPARRFDHDEVEFLNLIDEALVKLNQAVLLNVDRDATRFICDAIGAAKQAKEVVEE